MPRDADRAFLSTYVLFERVSVETLTPGPVMTKAKLSATIVVGDAVALAEGTGVGNLLGKGEGRGVGLPRIAVGMGVACVLFFEGAGDKDGRGVGFTVGLADGLGVGEGEGLIPQGHIR